MRIATALLFAPLFTLICTSTSIASTFQFEQGGFAEGAKLVGRFSGNDANGDGRLTTDTSPFNSHNELDSFTVAFTGNSLVNSFALGLVDILTAQFGVPCCGVGAGNEFYFDLVGMTHLEFVAMSANKLALLLADPPQGNFAAVGDQCAFVSGSGNCNLRSGAPYSPDLSAVPVPAPIWMLLSGLGALSLNLQGRSRPTMPFKPTPGKSRWRFAVAAVAGAA